MIVVVNIQGADRVHADIKGMARRVVFTKPAMAEVGVELMRITDATFRTEGRRGGGRWKELSPKWRARKERISSGQRMLVLTGALQSSLTEAGDPNMLLEVSRDRVLFGSKLPYANTQNRVRQFTKMTYSDRTRISSIVSRYVLGRSHRRRFG